MKPVYLSWSGGKDSALALHYLQRSREWQVVRLLTTVTDAYQRTSMHGLRRTLLRRQAAAVGLDVVEVVLPVPCSNEEYAARMAAAMEAAKAEGVTAVAFGDILLADIRAYREERLAEAGMEAVFPLWGRDTGDVAREFIDLGFKALLVCVDTAQLDEAFVGRTYDHGLLTELPRGVDPAGERGEFHTFVWDGPVFQAPVAFAPGPVTRREGLVFQDLLDAALTTWGESPSPAGRSDRWPPSARAQGTSPGRPGCPKAAPWCGGR